VGWARVKKVLLDPSIVDDLVVTENL